MSEFKNIDHVIKKYRIIAVANTVFEGVSEDDATLNFMMQAETLDVGEWKFIHVEEIK